MGRSIPPKVGVEINFNPDLCTGCGNCAQEVCFVDAITLNQKAKIEMKNCRCCGRCVEVCSTNALTIKIPLDAFKRSIECLEPLVDLEAE